MAIKLIRFRRLGLRGFLGLTKIKRSLLSGSGIRAVYAPFRKFTNLRRKARRGLGLEKFLPQQLATRGALPSLLGSSIGRKFFGKTRQSKIYKSTIARLHRVDKLSQLAGPFAPLFKRRSFSAKTVLPKLGRKIGKAAFRVGVGLSRTGARLNPTPVQPRAPKLNKQLLRAATGAFSRSIRAATQSMLKGGLTGTATVPGQKKPISFQIKQRRSGGLSTASLTFNGTNGKSLASVLSAIQKAKTPRLRAALISGFNRTGTAQIQPLLRSLPKLKNRRGQSAVLTTLSKKGGPQAHYVLRQQLAKQNASIVRNTKRVAPKTPKGTKTPRTTRTTTGNKKRGRPKSGKTKIQTKLTKQQRIARQLEGRRKSGDIKNIYYPRKPPTKRPKKGKLF